MKKKILIITLTVLALIAIFVTIAVAVESAQIEYGVRFENTHDSCCNTDGNGPHYNEGYTDGWLDGYDYQQYTIDSLRAELETMQSTIDSQAHYIDVQDEQIKQQSNTIITLDSELAEANVTIDSLEYKNMYLDDERLKAYEARANAVTLAGNYMVALEGANQIIQQYGGTPVPNPESNENAFLGSQIFLEYNVMIGEAAVEEYKGSNEYLDELSRQAQLGLGSAFESAYDMAYRDCVDAVYLKGKTDGYASYMATDEYKGFIEELATTEYQKGCLDGYEEGKAAGSVKYDYKTIISLVLVIISMCFVSLAVSLVIKRLKSKR